MSNLVSVEVKNNIGTIEDNLDAVEASIREKVSEYSAIVVTEDSVKDGKKFLADIRKEKKALDDERKIIKDAWMAPYLAFEDRVKKIIGLYDEPVKIVNDQLTEYEKQRKEMKRLIIEDTYNFVKEDMGDWIPLEKIYEKRWENATYTEKKIREDMELLFNQMKMSISTVKSMESEFEEEGLAVLKKTGSLQAAIDEIQSRKRMKEEILEKEEKKRLEEEQKALEEKKRLEEEQKALEEKKRLEEEQESGEEKKESMDVIKDANDELVVVDKETGEILPPPFEQEKEVVVKAYVRESNLKEFEEMLKERFVRYEVM